MTTPLVCKKCLQSIYWHRLIGPLAYCDPDVRSVETRSSFSVKQINAVHRQLGHRISDSAMDLERRER